MVQAKYSNSAKEEKLEKTPAWQAHGPEFYPWYEKKIYRKE